MNLASKARLVSKDRTERKKKGENNVVIVQRRCVVMCSKTKKKDDEKQSRRVTGRRDRVDFINGCSRHCHISMIFRFLFPVDHGGIIRTYSFSLSLE